MADNVTTTAQVIAALESTSAIIATDEVGGAQHQYVKLEFGGDGTATKVSASDPLPVVQTGALSVTANAGTNLNTSALATEATLAAYTATQRASAANVDGSQVTVTTGAGGVQVLASNSSRKGFMLYFVGSCYVSWGGTPTSSSFLVPGGSVLEMLSGLIYTGEIRALSVSGTVLVHRVEF